MSTTLSSPEPPARRWNQPPTRLVRIIGIVVLLIELFSIYSLITDESPWELWWVWLIVLLVLVVCIGMLFGHMYVKISDDGSAIRVGWWPLFRTTIPLDQLDSHRFIRITPPAAGSVYAGHPARPAICGAPGPPWS